MQKILLNKHENKIFESQTVFLSGNAFNNCTFKNCTLFVTNSPVAMNGCHIANCNWHLDYDIMWGNPATIKNLQSLLTMMEVKQGPASH